MADLQYSLSPLSTVLTIGNSTTPVGTIQLFDYRSTRSKLPIYVIGSEVPEIVGRSLRMTAGRLTGVVLSGGFLYEIISNEDMIAKYMLVFENLYGSATPFNEKQELLIQKFLSLLKKLNITSSTNKELTTIFEEIKKKLSQLLQVPGLKNVDNLIKGIDALQQAFATGLTNPNSSPYDLQRMYKLISDALQTVLSTYKDLGARPAIFLDELPPFDMTLVSMIIQDDLDSKERTALIDKTVFKDVEFMSELVSISAGLQLILESMDFVCTGVYKLQEIKQLI